MQVLNNMDSQVTTEKVVTLMQFLRWSTQMVNSIDIITEVHMK